MRKRSKNAPSQLVASYNSGSDEESGPEPEAAEPQRTKNNKLLQLRDEIPDIGCTSCCNVMQQMKQGQAWWVQCLIIYIAAALTYSYNNVGENSTNVQIAIMTVIVLVGATPFAATLIPTAIGAFVGGHNIIGSTGMIEDSSETQHVGVSNYLWLLVLSCNVSIIWCFVVTNPNLKILDGYSGRLGTTTFLGMNLTMLTIYGPAGVVGWNRYYYGFVRVIHFGEAEDSNSISSLMAGAWKWTEEAEVSIGYTLSVLWLAVLAGGTRILHNNYIQRCTDESISTTAANLKQAPKPLNNVLIPCIYALISMLIINATNYTHASGLFNGFAVGAYVGMASLQKIPSVAKFASVSLLASLWGLILTPFFVGFAGKSGFTSMLGHVTNNVLEEMFRRIQKMRNKRRRELQRELEQLQLEVQEQQHQEDIKQQQEVQPASPYIHHHKPKKETFYTKQQRRQQQKLKHLRQEEDKSHSYEHEQAGFQEPPKLHHRAWSALPTDADDGVWQHSLESQQQESNDVV